MKQKKRRRKVVRSKATGAEELKGRCQSGEETRAIHGQWSFVRCHVLSGLEQLLKASFPANELFWSAGEP